MPTYSLGNGDDVFDSALVADWTNDSVVFGGNGDDWIAARALGPTFGARQVVFGGNGDDTILLAGPTSFAFGGNGADELTATGGLGNWLVGGNGSDRLVSFGGGSGMTQGNFLLGGRGDDTFRIVNAGNLAVTTDAGNDHVVSHGDVFQGPMDVILDYHRGEVIELRLFDGPEVVPPYTRIEDVALTADPFTTAYLRPVVGDGEYAMFRGDFRGNGQFVVGPCGHDTLVIYDAFGGGDENISQGSVVLLGFTNADAVLIA